MTDEHHDWGNRTFYLAIALALISALWLWLDTKPKSVARTVTGILVVLISLAAVISTFLTGDSGAKQVWAGEASAPSATSMIEGAVDPEVAAESAITVDDVAEHATSDDCWSIINGDIYDLTGWISEHPGGSGPIESICGLDATQAFSNQHGGQSEPESELAGFKIGTLG